MPLKINQKYIYYTGTFAQSAETVEYTDCFTAEDEDPPPTSVLLMTLNNQMVTLQ